MLLRSALLDALPGLRHAFSTRVGGGSTGAGRAGLNLGPGDPPRVLADNRRRFGQRLGVPPARWVEVEQVHGVRIVDAASARREDRADGLLSREPGGPFVAVRTADCAPVLIAGRPAVDAAPVAVAAVHAGWRGATGGILKAALDRLVEAGAAPEACVAAIGPCIGVEAFEVGPEVMEAAAASIGGQSAPGLARGPGGRPHLDLPGLLTIQLGQLGLPPGGIEWVGGCTHRQPERFFSYRRDGADSGRQLSGIQLS